MLQRNGSEIAQQLSGKERKIQRIAAVAVIGIAAVGSYFGLQAVSDADAQNRKVHDQQGLELTQQAKADGFDVQPTRYDDKETVQLKLNLGNCAIDVSAQKVTDGDTITDVRNYHFGGYSLPTVKQDSRVRGTAARDVYNYYDGVPVQFTFQNQQELQDNILGAEPCETLAQTLVPPTTVIVR